MERTVRRQTLWRNIKKNRDNYLMLVPYSVFFIVFTVVPILVAIYLSFTYFCNTLLNLGTIKDLKKYIAVS